MATNTNTNLEMMRAVVRNGVELREVMIDERAIERALPKSTSVTVVKQSLKAGSTVAKGTAVDITLAVTRDLPVTIIDDAPKRFEKFTIGVIADRARKEPEILKILGDNPVYDDLGDPERAQFNGFLERAGVGQPADEAEAAAAYKAVMGAHTLAGVG